MRVKHTALFFVVSAAIVCLSGAYAASDSFYHSVEPGETLTRISSRYGISTQTIKEANQWLENPDIIIPGQRIFIPAMKPSLVVEPFTSQLYEILRMGSSNRWEYIVVHHSATETGSAGIFENYHLSIGFRALAYHFVVGNGTANTRDGQIEIGSRWPEQSDAAYAGRKARAKDTAGIHICLVGNFENSVPTQKQIETLIRLITHLAYRYNIPLENIQGHRDFVDNADITKCPGRNFPWEDLREAAKARGIG